MKGKAKAGEDGHVSTMQARTILKSCKVSPSKDKVKHNIKEGRTACRIETAKLIFLYRTEDMYVAVIMKLFST